jgi:predicted Zn-dependent protease
MQKALALWQSSAQSTDRLGFKDTTATTQAAAALAQAEVGNVAKTRELAGSSSSLVRGRGNLGPVAVALAMTGDVDRAQSLTDDLGRRFPDDTLLHNVMIPCVRALIALNHKTPDQAIQALQAATPYELGTALALLPVYVRGLSYLDAKRGTEAAAEFQKIIDHSGIVPTTPEHSLARLGLGRAYAMTGDSAKARAAYQDFFALWKDADPDVPVLKQAKAEYAKLP